MIGFELITLVVISSDCIGSCKSNYHDDHDDPEVVRVVICIINSVTFPVCHIFVDKNYQLTDYMIS
jgi:hypothetical protein